MSKILDAYITRLIFRNDEEKTLFHRHLKDNFFRDKIIEALKHIESDGLKPVPINASYMGHPLVDFRTLFNRVEHEDNDIDRTIDRGAEIIFSHFGARGTVMIRGYRHYGHRIYEYCNVCGKPLVNDEESNKHTRKHEIDSVIATMTNTEFRATEHTADEYDLFGIAVTHEGFEFHVFDDSRDCILNEETMGVLARWINERLVSRRGANEAQN